MFFRQAIPIPREQIPAPSLNKTVCPYGSRAACVELHNCWVCFLEETPALFLSCVFLNSARAFPHLASWVFHFLSTFPCQGTFLSLPRKCFSRAPARLPTSFNSLLKAHLLSENALTSHPRWRPPCARRFRLLPSAARWAVYCYYLFSLCPLTFRLSISLTFQPLATIILPYGSPNVTYLCAFYLPRVLPAPPAHGILAAWPGTHPSPCPGRQSLNHKTAGEAPHLVISPLSLLPVGSQGGGALGSSLSLRSQGRLSLNIAESGRY